MHGHITTDHFVGSLVKGRTLGESDVGQITAVVWGSRTNQGRWRTFWNSLKGDVSLRQELIVAFPIAMTVHSGWTRAVFRYLTEHEMKKKKRQVERLLRHCSHPSLLCASLLKLSF